MTHHDTGLYKSFAIVLGALVLFTLFIIVMANMFSPSTDYSQDPLIANSVKKQIEPVGRSNVRAVAEEAKGKSEQKTATTESAPSESAGEAKLESTVSEQSTESIATVDNTATADTSTVDNTAAQSATADSGVAIPIKVRAVVATNCAGCHANGVKGAQRNDDVAAWQSLAAKGVEALTANVISGKGEMPARAESSLDDAELQLAVQHMINKNLGNESAVASSSAATAAEPATTATVDKPTAEAIVLPQKVKLVVDTMCAACHVSGVGNAPKYGDKTDWAARMANGLDAVAASAIAGKGAMPPRGGSKLTDDEIKLAIKYMVSK